MSASRLDLSGDRVMENGTLAKIVEVLRRRDIGSGVPLGEITSEMGIYLSVHNISFTSKGKEREFIMDRLSDLKALGRVDEGHAGRYRLRENGGRSRIREAISAK